jgi:hypothetical protein
MTFSNFETCLSHNCSTNAITKPTILRMFKHIMKNTFAWYPFVVDVVVTHVKFDVIVLVQNHGFMLVLKIKFSPIFNHNGQWIRKILTMFKMNQSLMP